MAAANIHIAVPADFNYEVWASVAEKRLVDNGVWDVVQNGVPPDPTKIPELAATITAVNLAQWRNRVIKEMKALKIMQSSLPDSAFRKSLSVASAKDLWDSLRKGNEEAKIRDEEAKRRKLDKEFEDLMMYDGEPMEFYLERALDITERCSRSGNAKSDDEFIKKLLTSLSWEYDEALPVLKEIMNLPDMTLKDLLTIYDIFGDHPESMPHMLKDFYISLKKAKAEQMWCGLCKKYTHNQEDCYYNPMAVKSREFRGNCHRCGERGHYARDCSSRRNQQSKPEHMMLAVTTGNFTFDEDMWMIYTNSTNHMTPYVKFFTTLDRRYRGRVLLADGRVIMAQGKGDVCIVMKGVKKTIKNVLFVPQINRNVLSVSQITSGGYTVIMGGGECVIKDETGKVFAKTTWEERGIALRWQVVEGNLH